MLRSGLRIIRSPDSAGCRLVEENSGAEHEFGPQECFMLQKLHGGGDLEALSMDFSRQFGRRYTDGEMRLFLQKLADRGLLASPQSSGSGSDINQQSLSSMERPNRLHLFSPELFFAFLQSAFRPLRHAFLWGSLLLFLVGGYVASRHYVAFSGTISSAFRDYGLVGKILVTTITVNLATQIARGVVARHFALATPSFGIGLALGLLPRFSVTIVPSGQIGRKARLWLSGTPTLVRLAFCGGGAILWYLAIYSRGLSTLAALVSFMAFIGLAFSANPFWRSEGVNFFSALLRVPDLRERSHRMFWSLFCRRPPAIARHSQASRGMAVFGFCSIVFLYSFFAYIAYTVFRTLEKSFQGAGVVLALMLFCYIGFSMNRARKAKGRFFGRADAPE